jgi:hypothetical protein
MSSAAWLVDSRGSSDLQASTAIRVRGSEIARSFQQP